MARFTWLHVIAIGLQIISCTSQNITANQTCSVPVVCNDPFTTEWREIDLSGQKGGRGRPGKKGPQGERGQKGDQGPVGEDGMRGETGPEGPKGGEGPKGDKGVSGTKGQKGPQGYKGYSGQRGYRGSQGPAGATGQRGLKGSKGTPAPQNVISDLQWSVRILQDEVLWKYAFQASNDYRYKVISHDDGYSSGKRKCAAMGGRIAHVGVRSETVFNELYYHFSNKMKYAYIGLTDMASEGSFVWDDGESVYSYWTYWEDGEPDDWGWPGEDCVMVDNYWLTWNDVRCSDHQKTLCEKYMP